MGKGFAITVTSSSHRIKVLVPEIPVLDGNHLTALFLSAVGTEEGQSAEFRGVQAAHLEDLPDEEQLVATILPIDEAVYPFRTRPNLHAAPLR